MSSARVDDGKTHASKPGGRLPAGELLFQFGDLRFQRLQFFPRSEEDLALNVELLARHEVHLAESALEKRAKVLLQVVAKLLKTGRHGIGEPLGQFIEGCGIEHKG